MVDNKDSKKKNTTKKEKKVSKKFDSFPKLSYLCETNGGER